MKIIIILFYIFVLRDISCEHRANWSDELVNSLELMRWNENDKICLENIRKLFDGIKNSSLWAVSLWDATSLHPSGFISGTKHHFGSYDQCLYPGWTSGDYPELKAQYCLAEVTITSRDEIQSFNTTPYENVWNKLMEPRIGRVYNKLIYGFCTPSSCSPEGIETFASVILKKSHQPIYNILYNVTIIHDSCQTDRSNEGYDVGYISFYIIWCFIIFGIIGCTIYHNKYLDSVPDAVKALSLITNYKTLLQTRKSNTNCLDGIRFLSSVLIVQFHNFFYFFSAPQINADRIDKAIWNPLYYPFSHMDLIVDTFFAMSGMLCVYQLVKSDKKINIINSIVKRYLRLTPALAMIIFFIASVFWYTGDGPMWILKSKRSSDVCRKNFWLNLIMLYNYIDPQNMCFPVSWYVAVDFQFYIMNIFLYLIYIRYKRVAFTLVAIMFPLSIALIMYQTYSHKLSASLIINYEILQNMYRNKDINLRYYQSHLRFPTYCIGMCLGYTIAKIYPINNTRTMKRKWSISLAVSGLLIMLLMASSLTIFYIPFREYNPIEVTVYAGFNRSIWTCGLSMVIIACIYGNVPIINSILSWKIFQVLSKLSYSLYLVHSILIERRYSSVRTPLPFHFFDMVYASFGDVTVSLLFALVLFLFIELPVINLYTVLTTPKIIEVENIEVLTRLEARN